MTVHVAIDTHFALITGPEGLCMLAPLTRPLRARMGKDAEADFEAHVVYGMLELGEKLRKS